jgi:hypothetical protein
VSATAKSQASEADSGYQRRRQVHRRARFVETSLDVEEGWNRQRENSTKGKFSEHQDKAGGKSGHAGILSVKSRALTDPVHNSGETESLARTYHSME